MANKKANVQDKYIHTYLTLNLNIFIKSFNNSNGQQCSLKKRTQKASSIFTQCSEKNAS